MRKISVENGRRKLYFFKEISNFKKKGRGRTIALIRIRKETKGKEGRDLKEEEGNLEE